MNDTWFRCFFFDRSHGYVHACSMCRLLNPEQDSSSALFVGNLVTQLIMQLSVRMAPHIRDLIAALVIRMQSTDVAVFKTKLIICVCKTGTRLL